MEKGFKSTGMAPGPGKFPGPGHNAFDDRNQIPHLDHGLGALNPEKGHKNSETLRHTKFDPYLRGCATKTVVPRLSVVNFHAVVKVMGKKNSRAQKRRSLLPCCRHDSSQQVDGVRCGSFLGHGEFHIANLWSFSGFLRVRVSLYLCMKAA